MNTQGPAAVSFEVYSFDGQRWTLHARFQRHERERAVEEAKYIEQHMMLGCKVVRETYFPSKNTSDESTIYISDKSMLRPRATPKRVFIATGTAARGNSPVLSSSHRSNLQSPQSLSVFSRMVLVVAASMLGAGAIAGIGNAFMSQLPPKLFMGRDITPLILFSLFLVSFLAIAVPLALKFVDWRDEGGLSGERDNAPPVPATPSTTNAPAPFTPMPPVPAKPAEEKPDATKENHGVEKSPVEEAPAPIPDPIEQAQQAAIEPIPDLTADNSPAEEAKPEQGGALGPQDKLLSEAEEKAEQRRTLMMRFLSQILAEIKRINPALDSYNRFGVHLVLTGGLEKLGTTEAIPDQERHSLLLSIFQVMGTKAEAAQKFVDRYDDYLTEPRYLAMVQGGRTAMDSFLAGGKGATSHLALLFEAWNRPQSPQASSRVVTVMFTDMVGSTDLTQQLGDQAAQEVVRQHNTIVRAALAEHAGREVKHTGDGIMASFPSAGNGVEAAIAIQRAVAGHSRDNPELPFQIRIGLDAGEPIEEDDDLFGTTVQLASRTCAAAQSGQVLCTNVVKELSSGRGYEFNDLGAQQLKGFKDKISLFEIKWNPIV